jgi:hypothetical protein
MADFTLVLLDATEAVSAVRTLRVGDLGTAMEAAEMLLLTQPAAAGYELWVAGNKIAAAHPGRPVRRTDPIAEGLDPSRRS